MTLITLQNWVLEVTGVAVAPFLQQEVGIKAQLKLAPQGELRPEEHQLQLPVAEYRLSVVRAAVTEARTRLRAEVALRMAMEAMEG